ncbi:ubiquitin carboxyl-terminal hydrolase 34-like [Pocillopora damicornis]|uniref:ubiquitin carboxyl-terminal hydrolase 34-like n=1 Tax=Pocillopora damicornis TaxID=46731 RepID=UPI000F55964D|nr:ubiquitin carboxyl-terminal hydrolase 34-like [Pocillopora damicornis]
MSLARDHTVTFQNHGDSLDLAFKYFTSSTLTVRLAGLSQIANQVHMFMDLFQTDPASEIDRQCLCTELSQWLIENKLVEHLFGPNLHVELLKQSQIILNYLARETCLTTSHLDCIWLAAQLKHASRYVHDLLTVLTKHMDMPSILYLLDLVSKLPPAAHTRQTLYLALVLIRIVWRAGLSPAVAESGTAVHTNSPVHGPLTAGSTSAAVASAMQRKFSRTASLSQSSSRSGSLSDISCDGEQLDMEESLTHGRQKYTRLSSKGSADMETEEIPHPPELRQTYAGQAEDYSSQDKTGGEDADIDSTSCTNSRGSSLSDRRDLDDFDAEGVQDELTQLKTVAALRVMQEGGEERQRSLGFDLNTVCEQGKTLLWDLIQDDNAIHLSDGLVQEAEKLLCQLICYTGEKKIRMKFIEGCVANLAANRSVVMSIQLLPKLFSSFQQFASSDQGAGQVDVLWDCLVCDSESSDDTLEWFLQQAQSKEFHALDVSALQYILAEKLPSLPAEKFSMTGLHLLQQLYKMFKHADVKPCDPSKLCGIDQLWNIAVQVRSSEVSWAAITYLNSLYINANGGALKFEDEFIQRCMNIIGGASKQLNQEQNLQIMERGLLLLKSHIESFKRRFAFHLRLWWLEGRGITCHQQITQRPTEKHYPIRVLCQPAGLSDKGTFEMNSSDLVADLRAEVTFWCRQLQDKLKKDTQLVDGSSQHTPLSPFSSQLHPPFRLISQGHELTPDLDEKSLAEVGFKDLQLVFVSVGAVRRDRHHDSGYIPSSSLPSPEWNSTPMIILLHEKYFDQLFLFLEALDGFIGSKSSSSESPLSDSSQLSPVSKKIVEANKAHDECEEIDSGSENQGKPPLLPLMESRVEFLCGITWELLFLLPTNQSILNKLKYFGRVLHQDPKRRDTKSDEEQRAEKAQPEKKLWDSLLDPNFPHKLLYSLQVIDLIHNSSKESQTQFSPTYSRLSSDSDISDNEEEKETATSQVQIASWGLQFIEYGGLGHLYSILMSGCLEVSGNCLWTQWRQECLAHLLKLICEFGTMKRSNEDDDEVFATTESIASKSQIQKRDGQFRVRYKSTDKEEVICIKCLSSNLMSIVDVNSLLEKLLHISHQATLPIHGGQNRASGGDVVRHAVSLLVSAAFTDGTVRSSLLQQSNFKPWLQQLVLLAKEPSVRFEACRGLYRLSLIKENSCLTQLMDALLDSLPLAQSLQSRENPHGRRQEPSAREYFSILCRLVDGLPTVEDGQKGDEVDLDSLAKLLAKYIRDCQPRTKQKYGSHENEGLSGMLKLCTAVMRHDPSFKMSTDGLEFLRDVFHSCLFSLPEDCCDERDLPLCKSKPARSAAFDLLLEMARGCQDNFLEIQKLLMKHHSSDGRKRSSYGWHYWPHDNGRSLCGLVGMINLGATCYMASCMQQLYMMPQARAAILNSRINSDVKHEVLMREMQRMFCFLMASERKAYNPKTFCRTYTMDKQPLNTGEQKDMTEFFTDLIGKIEEMSPTLKLLVRDLFCGEISNNVVSLDCSHVSKTREEFYSVRCTVADMKSLYESLDEVTIKDTLDGDNMYTCSQCGKKVRAEKRACFQVLPRILCFNTMRYAFNMVTMMKEKVNTHFSFPLQLNMAPYTEEFLMGDKQDQDPQLDLSYWYQLIGVVVHTGTAEGGHYYSFILDRSSPQGRDQWFLFNDAEVKPFDPAQIAAECFGGEMTTKTYDAVTEKFMDFSFEKTHSAYMLFYERCDPNEKELLAETPNIELSQELADWIWHDNIQFLHDKHVFDTTYFNFMWLICSSIAPSVPDSKELVLSNVKLGTSFLLETLVHAKEKIRQLHLSENDMAALTGGKGFPFLFHAIKDSINLRHTTNLIFSLCRYNLKLAESIISLLMSSVQKLPPEQSHSFFKLLSMLTEMQGGPPGMPSFTNLTLARIWEAAEYNAALCIDWLTCMAPKNRMAHQWVLENMDKWVEKYLIADNSLRLRNASAYLLVSLVPNSHFRQGFRSRSFSAPHKEMVLSKDALSILHEIYKMLLNLLPRARKYCVDRNIHGTTKLVSYFAVLNYCLVSKTEKEMFTPFCTELWRLFHPLMSEPNIAVHPNKQALLIFWFHACISCEKNIDFITENSSVAANIPLNYILSSDEPEVVNFNRNVLPAYYGLLRLCCEHSRSFTHQLAVHSNMKWAFENLTIRMNQYPQAVEELFALMRLFAGVTSPDPPQEKSKEEEAFEASFRRDTIILYQNCLDGGASWTTLISAYKILLQTDEDRLTVVVNQGLLTLSDAFTTLHMMYHEATACHVTGDLTEVLMILHNLLVCCRPHSNKQDVRSSILGWSERFDVAQKLLSLLNTYTPKEVRQSCLDVLNAMLVLYPGDITEALIPIISASHQHWNKTSPPGLLGPYFPRRHSKMIVSSKSVARPAVPELNMFLHPSFLDSPKGVEELYDTAVAEYFQPYHHFVDKLLRYGFGHDRVPEHVITCSCLLAIEAIPLHFTFFSSLWMEVYQKAGEIGRYKTYIQQLCQKPEFLEVTSDAAYFFSAFVRSFYYHHRIMERKPHFVHQLYVDLILLDERESLNVRDIYSFLCCFFPRVSSQVLVKQWNNLVQTLVATVIADKPAAEKANDTELCAIAKRLTAELRAMSLLFSVRPPHKSDVSPLLQPSLNELLVVCRKYQAKKLEAKLRSPAVESEQPPSQQQGKEESSAAKTEGDDGPVKKRRRTQEEEDEASAKTTSGPSDKPGTSKDDSTTASKKEKTQENSQKKAASIWGARPPTDWVDSLVKAIQNTISKVPT